VRLVTAIRLQEIDDTNRRDHAYLGEDDECYFLYEYTAGAGWRGGDTNQLIHNLQKKSGDGGFHYKAPAIARCAAAFSETITGNWLAESCLVPVPPSKIRTDPLYDDRMHRVCSLICKPGAPKVIELIEQIESTETFKGGNRKRPDELRANYRFEEQSLAGLPQSIGIVDDVLTTGSHFRAIKDMILERLPDHRVIGFFVARRAIPSPFENVSLEELLK
jgi:hypothetical protein